MVPHHEPEREPCSTRRASSKLYTVSESSPWNSKTQYHGKNDEEEHGEQIVKTRRFKNRSIPYSSR